MSCMLNPIRPGTAQVPEEPGSSRYNALGIGVILMSDGLVSFHPETPDEKLAVSDLESGDFSFWQGNRGIARRRTTVRRTSKTED